MEEYDVLIVGGGIAGSVAAKFLAQSGFKTLLIEKEKVPRNKACSGIQFMYFEKILGEKIPQERLCNNQLTQITMYMPNGRSTGTRFKMLNFMRKPFDEWLNTVAQGYGAEFRDQCKIMAFEENPDSVISTIAYKKDNWEKFDKIKSRYLIDASGLRSPIRKIIRPQDFSNKTFGSTINFYIDGSSSMKINTLYQFWNMEWNDAMFAWVYTKTLDDGKDYWVVGTGCNSGKVMDRQAKFYDYIKKNFALTGEIVKREGYASNIDMLSKERVWLGQNRILMVGDAAGLIDQVRGVGMDAAALSGRIVAKAITQAEKRGITAFPIYTKLMRRVVNQTVRNQNREIGDFASNKELQIHLQKNMIKMGVGLMMHAFLNKLRSPIKQKLLPP